MNPYKKEVCFFPHKTQVHLNIYYNSSTSDEDKSKSLHDLSTKLQEKPECSSNKS